MFGQDWDKAEATIVARDAKFSGDGSVATYTYVADVRLSSGETFRATVREPTIATDFWAPSIRDVVSVLVRPKDRKVKFDKDDDRLSVKAYEAAKKKAFEAGAGAAGGHVGRRRGHSVSGLADAGGGQAGPARDRRRCADAGLHRRLGSGAGGAGRVHATCGAPRGADDRGPARAPPGDARERPAHPRGIAGPRRALAVWTPSIWREYGDRPSNAFLAWSQTKVDGTWSKPRSLADRGRPLADGLRRPVHGQSRCRDGGLARRPASRRTGSNGAVHLPWWMVPDDIDPGSARVHVPPGLADSGDGLAVSYDQPGSYQQREGEPWQAFASDPGVEALDASGFGQQMALLHYGPNRLTGWVSVPRR